MIYLTAGVIDGYEDADVDMETAIIKVKNIIFKWQYKYFDKSHFRKTN